MRISYWSSDVCSSDLSSPAVLDLEPRRPAWERHAHASLLAPGQLGQQRFGLRTLVERLLLVQQRAQLDDGAVGLAVGRQGLREVEMDGRIVRRALACLSQQIERLALVADLEQEDRKSTRLNSSH